MTKNTLVAFISAMLLLTITGCTGYISTEELDAEIQSTDKQIEQVGTELNSTQNLVIRNFIAIRLETLKNTRAMLEQKRTGIKRFIKIDYTINGTKIDSNTNIQAMAAELEKSITSNDLEIANTIQEATRFRGSLIENLYTIQTELLKMNNTFLKQKLIALKHELPTSMYPQAEQNTNGDKKNPYTFDGKLKDNL